MTLKNGVDPIITRLLKEVIVENADSWKNYTQEQVTDYDLFSSYDIPKANIDRPWIGCIITDLDNPKLLKISEMLGATRCVNAAYMPANSMMYWHTNSDSPGERTYYNLTLDPGVFKFLDQDGKPVEDWDDKGWTTRSFKINKDKPFWHCVWAKGARFSFGFTKELL